MGITPYKEIQMKITLKNIKVNLRFSQETTMFDADLYIDGVKVGYAENRGCGGNTNISAIGSGETLKTNRELIEKADDYCKTLPSENYEYEENGKTKTFAINCNLENFVDNLLSDYIEQKEKKRFQSKLAKDLEKFICISKTRNIDDCQDYQTIKFKSYVSLNQIFANSNLREKVLTHISQRQKEGFFVLNSNLPI